MPCRVQGEDERLGAEPPIFLHCLTHIGLDPLPPSLSTPAERSFRITRSLTRVSLQVAQHPTASKEQLLAQTQRELIVFHGQVAPLFPPPKAPARQRHVGKYSRRSTRNVRPHGESSSLLDSIAKASGSPSSPHHPSPPPPLTTYHHPFFSPSSACTHRSEIGTCTQPPTATRALPSCVSPPLFLSHHHKRNS